MQELKPWEVSLKRKLDEREILLGVIVTPEESPTLTYISGVFTSAGLLHRLGDPFFLDKRAVISEMLNLLTDRIRENQVVIAMILWRNQDQYTICWSPQIDRLTPEPETLWPTIQRLLRVWIRELREDFRQAGQDVSQFPMPPRGWIGDWTPSWN